jgi:DNA (cytosine-5)-methyltransferase 1
MGSGMGGGEVKPRLLDLFAGPGGWDEGAAMIGVTNVVGLEWDRTACRTAVAAGHARIQTDVALYPTSPFVGKVGALIASPPCQAWSMAGKRKGELDRANCHRLADRMAAGDDSLDWTDWEDPRSALVCQPVRWVRDLRPPIIALEEVPAVQGLWEHFARIFRAWGYNVWVKVLCAADYGVPQERYRVILGGSLQPTTPPEPTHTEGDLSEDLFGEARAPWITMSSALGWGFRAPSATVSSGGASTGGAEPFANAKYRERLKLFVQRERSGDRSEEGFDPDAGPCQAITSKARSWQVWQTPLFMAAGVTGEGRPKDPETQPADTITGKGTAYWAYDRPATTVVGSFRPDIISGPGYRTTTSRQNAEGSVRVTVSEAGILQSFPADYPWQGSRSNQYEQVGNAVPPRLAAHVLASLGLGSLDQLEAAA